RYAVYNDVTSRDLRTFPTRRSSYLVDSHAQQPGKGIGRIRYKDLNGDGTINSLDQKYIGVASPEFQYGLQTSLKYKNVTLDLFLDRKSTRLNSSHVSISYAVFCLKY